MDDEKAIGGLSPRRTSTHYHRSGPTASIITAKDFRTWTGTVLAHLCACGTRPPRYYHPVAKRNITRAIERVSARLGNTPTICRKCYIHPEIMNAYLEGGLSLDLRQNLDGQPNEAKIRFGRRRQRSSPSSAPASPTLRVHPHGHIPATEPRRKRPGQRRFQ